MNLTKLKRNIIIPIEAFNAIRKSYLCHHRRYLNDKYVVYCYNVLTDKEYCTDFLKKIKLYNMYIDSFKFIDKNQIDAGHIPTINPICEYLFKAIYLNLV